MCTVDVKYTILKTSAQLNSFARWENVPLPGRLSHEGSWGLSRESQEVVIIVIVAIVGMSVVIRWCGN